jgi:hypothetical protein
VTTNTVTSSSSPAQELNLLNINGDEEEWKNIMLLL